MNLEVVHGSQGNFVTCLPSDEVALTVVLLGNAFDGSQRAFFDVVILEKGIFIDILEWHAGHGIDHDAQRARGTFQSSVELSSNLLIVLPGLVHVRDEVIPVVAQVPLTDITIYLHGTKIDALIDRWTFPTEAVLETYTFD